MKSPRFQKVLAITLSLTAVAGIVWMMCLLANPEPEPPVYQDKTLLQWLALLDWAADQQPSNFDEVTKAQSAIRAIGTNALPFALADLRAPVTFKERLGEWLRRRGYSSLAIHSEHAGDRWARGVQVLDLLGPIARGGLPQLIAEATNNPGFSEEAMLAVGVAALPAFTNLLRTAHAPETEILIRAFSQTVRCRQISRAEAAQALPILLKEAQSKDRPTAGAATEAVNVIQDTEPTAIVNFTNLTMPNWPR